MKRRGFLGSLLALGVAPAIVRADSLMKVKPIIRVGVVPAFRDPIFYTNLCKEIVYDADGTWRIAETKVESQITVDKWYTPPERVISARPFIPSSELKSAIYDAHVRGQPLDARIMRDIRAMMRHMESA